MKSSGKKRIVLLALSATLATAAAKAQEVSIAADLVSNYIWRGEKCGDAGFQPSVTFGYKGFSFTAWGSTDFTGDAFELDLTAAYTAGKFEFALTDYFATSDVHSESYFHYRAGAGHVFEGTVNYTVSETIPLTVSWNTYFAGTDDTYAAHDYSTYIEAAYPFTLDCIDLESRIGLTPWKGAYADRFNVVNLSLRASKTFPLKAGFALEPYVELIFNPAAEKAFMVFGLGI